MHLQGQMSGSSGKYGKNSVPGKTADFVFLMVIQPEQISIGELRWVICINIASIPYPLEYFFNSENMNMVL